MSEANVKLVQDGLDLFARGEFDAVLDQCVHPEVELTPLIGPLLGIRTIRGREAVRRFWTDQVPEGLGEAEITPRKFEDFGDAVLVEATYRARGPESGIELEQDFVTVYAIRDGLIHRIQDYFTRTDALEAAGLSE